MADPSRGEVTEIGTQLVAEALEQGDVDRAEEIAREAQASDPQAAAEAIDAIRLIRRGEALLERRSRDGDGHVLLARGYFLANVGEAAMREARRALDLNSGHGEAHVLIGLEQCYRGDVDAARQSYQHASALLPAANDWLKALSELLQNASPADSPSGTAS
ncbi:MAG: hypothetical protein EXR51_04370 [Dehalococcoidia bacterium]|nr:hypothetical protein [Dehalococcoidia bacterium]